MAPRILLLGAAGFIGQSICRQFVEEGSASELLLHFRRRGQPGPAQRGLEWRQLDLRRADLNGYAELVESVQPDVVINCVGLTKGSSTDLHALNVDVVTKLIATLAGKPHIHLVQIGSAAEYGVQRDGVPVAETALPTPTSAYGLSKYEATRRLMDSVAAGRVNVSILRVFNPLGRYSSPATLAGSAAVQIHAALRAGNDTVHLGNLSSWRDYVDTRDVARAALSAACERPHGGVVLNVGRGQAVQSRQLISALVKVSGFDGSIIEAEAGSGGSGVVRWQCADVTAIRDQLGWSPLYSLDDSVRDLWDEIERPLHDVRLASTTTDERKSG